ncbi:MAG: YeiH family protein [Acidobacteriota bacterium]
MSGSGMQKLYKTEDWWSVWLGLGIVLLALTTFWAGKSIKGWAVVPGKWTQFDAVLSNLSGNVLGYLTIFLMFGLVFAFSMAIMGHKLSQFIPGFIILFVGSLVIFYAAGWKTMEDFNVEAPLLALIVGLVISNLMKMPEWFKTSLRTEYYIKTGIVLLGATLPLTLIFSAGPIAFLQATLVSVGTWLTIYLAATKIFKLEPQFGAVLGAAGAVCGVSASIAVGGAVKAKKDHISIAIAVVTVWAIVMIFALTFALKHMVPDVIAPGVAGAWVGTSEFADAAGFAVVAELATRFGDSPINAFTLMKVIGRDIWIGIWCLILAVVSVVFWEKKEASEKAVGAGIVWERFPKFVLGFFAASVIMSLVASQIPANHVGVAKFQGKYKDVKYSADFSGFQVPAAFADRMTVDTEKGTLSFKGKMSHEDFTAIKAATTSQDQIWAVNQLQVASDWFESVLSPNVIKPIKQLRSWAFVICFLCIGLSTRFAELSTFGMKPFWAFTIGVLVNVPLGFFLSTVVFVDFWSKI